MARRLALATAAELPGLTEDDRAFLIPALRRRGIDAVPVVWNAAEVGWERFSGCLIRSVWDYPRELAAFLAWVEDVAASMPVWNPPGLVAWNSRKDYLREIEGWGVATIPTVWLRQGASGDRLETILAERGWEEAVVKPAVDLGALNLRRVGVADPAGQAHLEELLSRHDVLVQPFLPSLESKGELSLFYVEGRRTHAVEKLPAAGDFRVQGRWGGSSRAVEPGDTEAEIGERVLARLPEVPLYARVDLVEGPAGERYLIELELIDPNLFLLHGAATAEALADAIDQAL